MAGLERAIQIADDFGFKVGGQVTAIHIAAQLVGQTSERELAVRLQSRYFKLLDRVAGGVHPAEYRFCPRCGSESLHGFQATDEARDDMYFIVECKACGWHDGTEV